MMGSKHKVENKPICCGYRQQDGWAYTFAYWHLNCSIILHLYVDKDYVVLGCLSELVNMRLIKYCHKVGMLRIEFYDRLSNMTEIIHTTKYLLKNDIVIDFMYDTTCSGLVDTLRCIHRCNNALPQRVLYNICDCINGQCIIASYLANNKIDL
jgi:hypothetical protein